MSAAVDAQGTGSVGREEGARRALHRLAVLLTLILASAALAIVTAATPAVAAPCDPPVTNPVACENTLPGSPESEWGITGAGSTTIQGFATDMSVDQGETVDFKVDTTANVVPPRHLPDGVLRRRRCPPGRHRPASTRASTTSPTASPTRRRAWSTAATGPQTASWAVPADAVSGIYFAQAGPHRRHRRGEPHLLRGPRRRRRLRPPVPDLRHHLAGLQRVRRQQPVLPAADRPGAPTRSATTGRSPPAANAPEDWVFDAEYPMVRFLESQRVRRQLHHRASTPTAAARELLEHEAFLSVGHDEYWSGTQRANVEAARDAGVNLAFFSGQRGVLEDPLGEQHRRLRRPPYRPWSPTRRRTPTRRSTRTRRPGPAPGATRGSARRPTAGDPRTR